jgi:hypothetical protein
MKRRMKYLYQRLGTMPIQHKSLHGRRALDRANEKCHDKEEGEEGFDLSYLVLSPFLLFLSCLSICLSSCSLVLLSVVLCVWNLYLTLMREHDLIGEKYEQYMTDLRF